MHFGDTIVIFVLALILFGPKKLPEIGRQIAKLLAEFRRASNEFKMQIDEELRGLEQQERQKQIAAATTPDTIAAADNSSTPSILPPSTGEPVSADSPYSQQYHMEGPPSDTASESAEPTPETAGAPFHVAEPSASTPAAESDTSEARLEGPPPDLAAAAAEPPIAPSNAAYGDFVGASAPASIAATTPIPAAEPPDPPHPGFSSGTRPDTHSEAHTANGTLNSTAGNATSSNGAGIAPAASDETPENAHHHG